MLQAAVRWCLLSAMFLAFSRDARAVGPPSVAVLPLDQAAASAEYDGLGRALAGMVVSDLSLVPGLRLVERDRLDALLAEMNLSKTGFVDPKTAQKLGSGVGAQFVVLGAFTVIASTFALDARIVEVRTGDIVKAADAHGTISEFVAVEKELVEILVDGLDLTLGAGERRAMMLQAPTERFDAFSAYGEGLAREQEGAIDEAKAAYARALAKDPAFAAAHAALEALGALVTEREDEHAGAERSTRDAAYAAFLAGVPDERTRPKGFDHDQQSVAKFALRMGIFEEQARDCDRYAEMRSYLSRVRWNVVDPPRRAGDSSVALAIEALAGANGLDREAVYHDAPRYLQGTLAARSRVPFTGTAAFVLDAPMVRERSHGMVSSLVACLPADRALAELDALIADARAAGADRYPPSIWQRDIGLPDALRFEWMYVAVAAEGVTPEVKRRTELMVAAHRGGPAEATVLALVDGVLASARADEDHAVRTRGLSNDEVVRRMRLLATGRLPPTPPCQPATNRYPAIAWVTRWDEEAAHPADASNMGPDRLVEDAFAVWAPAADLGCIEGVAARFTPTAAWAYLDGAHGRATPTQGGSCPATWAQFDQALAQSRALRRDATTGPTVLFSALASHTNLVYGRCAFE